MTSIEQTRNPYLNQLEQDNPGYVATDRGREITLDHVSRVNPAELAAYHHRMALLGERILKNTVEVEQ